MDKGAAAIAAGTDGQSGSRSVVDWRQTPTRTAQTSTKYETNTLAAAPGLLYEMGDVAIQTWLVLAGAFAPARGLGAD